MSHVILFLNVESERATLTWSEGPASFEPYHLEGQVFKESKGIAETAREKLSDVVKDCLFAEDNVAQSCADLAEAGHELYEALFDPVAEQRRRAREVRKWLEHLRDRKSVDRLEIAMESPWSLPWNVIYDKEPDKRAFLSDNGSLQHWKPFWGVRYNVTGGRKVNPLRRLPLLEKPKVLLVVDPEIRDGLPEELQQRLQSFIESHELTLATNVEQLTEAVTAGRPNLLYWLSHATPSALVLDDEEVTPRKIRKLFRSDDDDAPLGGLAFLNACQTAEAGETGSFLDAFHTVGFSGMIGTEHQTIDTFAAPLGLDFLEAFLDEALPVGDILHRLRSRVPLGLLYGTYCPPDILIQMDDAVRKSTSRVSLHLPALGTALRGEAVAKHLTKLPDEPYRSLDFYDRADRPLFAGRDDDVARFAFLLDDADARIVVLHGESGVGKSSFLRAGIIPFLEEECPGYRFLRTRHVQQSTHEGEQAQTHADSVLFVRATNDLIGQLAEALCHLCAKPLSFDTPTGKSVEVDLPRLLADAIGPRNNGSDRPDPAVLRSALSHDAGLLASLLSNISDRLPFALVLVIDQCEEIYTLAESPEDAENRRRALAMLRRTSTAGSDFKIILSLRTRFTAGWPTGSAAGCRTPAASASICSPTSMKKAWSRPFGCRPWTRRFPIPTKCRSRSTGSDTHRDCPRKSPVAWSASPPIATTACCRWCR